MLFRSAAISEKLARISDQQNLGEDAEELLLVMAPPAARHDHHDGDHGADHGRRGEGPERLGNADPGATPASSLTSPAPSRRWRRPAGAGRAAVLSSRLRPPQPNAMPLAANPKDHRESDPVGDFQLPTVDHGGQDQDRGTRPTPTRRERHFLKADRKPFPTLLSSPCNTRPGSTPLLESRSKKPPLAQGLKTPRGKFSGPRGQVQFPMTKWAGRGPTAETELEPWILNRQFSGLTRPLPVFGQPYADRVLVVIVSNWLLVARPTTWIAARQTMMIRASITAYSTAVGPSSETRKRYFLGEQLHGFLRVQSWPGAAFDWLPSGTNRKKWGGLPRCHASPKGQRLPAMHHRKPYNRKRKRLFLARSRLAL